MALNRRYILCFTSWTEASDVELRAHYVSTDEDVDALFGSFEISNVYYVDAGRAFEIVR